MRHAALGLILLASAGSARAQAPADPGAYREAIRIFAATGETGIAVEPLLGWNQQALELAADNLTKTGDDRLMETAALLHLEMGAAIAGFSPAAAQRQFDVGARLVDALFPVSPDARRNLSVERADEIASIRSTWHGVAGSVFLSVNDVLHSRPYFAKALDIKPGSAPILTLQGTADEIDGASQDPNDADVARIRTRIERDRLRLLLSAEHLYRRALEANPAYPLAQIRLGRAEHLLTNYRQAGEWLRKGSAAAQDPAHRYLAAMFSGALQQEQQDLAGARASFETALALSPKSQSAVVALAYVELITGRPDRAQALARAYTAAAHEDEAWWAFSGMLDHAGLRWLRRRVLQ